MLNCRTETAVVELLWLNSVKVFPTHSKVSVANGFPPESWHDRITFDPLLYDKSEEEGSIAGSEDGGSKI